MRSDTDSLATVCAGGVFAALSTLPGVVGFLCASSLCCATVALITNTRRTT